MPTSSSDFIEENNGGSDSESNSDDAPEYYQPISSVDRDIHEDSDQINSDEEHYGYDASDSRTISNGYHTLEAENGISVLDLNDELEQKSSEDEEEEAQEERMREASDSAISMAYREDESRRNAPLTPENAMRVMEAMRGVSFGGLAPDWAGRVPEEQWIDQLRRLRRPPGSFTTVQN